MTHCLCGTLGLPGPESTVRNGLVLLGSIGHIYVANFFLPTRQHSFDLVGCFFLVISDLGTDLIIINNGQDDTYKILDNIYYIT